MSDDPPFSLRQLAYVVALSETGSFRRAADRFGVTQPALSAQLGRLETALGATLFERGARGARPTEAGRAVVERARRVLAETADLAAVVAAGRGVLHGAFRLGAIPTVAPFVLPAAAPLLRKRHPDLRLYLTEARTEDLVARVERGELDAALLAKEAELGGLSGAKLFDDPFLLAAPREWDVARTAPFPLARLGELDGRVLVLEEGHCLGDQARAVCERLRIDVYGDFRAGGLATQLEMVAGGLGAAFLPALAIPLARRYSEQVRLLPLACPRPPRRTIMLAWRPTSPRGEDLAALVRALRTCAPAAAVPTD
jgi:LysR family hydrogen peroxide-inducible transcriptional activator